ncbi:MAG: hypothetical protein JW936_00970 [Sedimentisphaerales bacterium]|nr:hypothetical protein [Sedimentisphaerales bacterium]
MLLNRSNLAIGFCVLAALGFNYAWALQVDIGSQESARDDSGEGVFQTQLSDGDLDFWYESDPNDPNGFAASPGECLGSNRRFGFGGGGVADVGERENPQRYLDNHYSNVNSGYAPRSFSSSSGDIDDRGRPCDWPGNPNARWSRQRHNWESSGVDGDYPEPAACFGEGAVEDGWDPLQYPQEPDDEITTAIIPEPIVVGMLAVGGGVLLRRRQYCA